MTITALGKVAVPVPGTPVPLTADKTIVANKLVVSQVPATTGAVYLRYIKASSPGIIARAFLAPGASGFTDEHVLESPDGNRIVPGDWAIDAANANEGLNVYWITD